MEPFTVKFLDQGRGILTREIRFGNKNFREQLDADGWYPFHGYLGEKIDITKAVGMALEIIRARNPNFTNLGRVRIRLYEFNLLQLQEEIRNIQP